MVQHLWNSANAFEYCILDNCTIEGDIVKLNSDELSGSVVSEIKDSSQRIFWNKEFRFDIATPTNTSIAAYYRSGTTDVYSSDTWTDWILCDTPSKRVEYTLSLTDVKVIADYDINELLNIYNEADYRFNILWSALTDMAIVDYARVDYDPAEVTQYATDSVFNENVVPLKNALPNDNVNLMLEYTPADFVIDNNSQFVQWKMDLTSTELGTVPSINSASIDYMLSFQNNIQSGFPLMFRRL